MTMTLRFARRSLQISMKYRTTAFAAVLKNISMAAPIHESEDNA